jgi:hypothetical protein
MKAFIHLTFIVVFFSFIKCQPLAPTNKLISDVKIGYNLPQKVKTYAINTEDIITQGIEFPYKFLNNETNTLESSVKVSFKVKDNGRLYYKIYYQNESYKFPEDHEWSYENFYGSWSDTTIGFKEIKTDFISDSFKIVGNPRFEKKYFGASFEDFFIDEDKIKKVVQSISNVPEWKADVEKKAKQNKMTYEEQAMADALWVLKDNRNKGNTNHAWKRNPRMGKYSAMIVVCTEEALKKIPDYVQFINKTDEKGTFVNPYKYFLVDNPNQEGVSIYLDSTIFSLSLAIKPGNGIYVDKTKLPIKTLNYAEDSMCGSSHRIFEKALFEQFFSHENRNFKLNTIPVLADWSQNDYTPQEYLKNKQRFEKDTIHRIHSWIRNVDCPCKEVKDNYDYIEIWNPENQTLEKAAKLNVGVMTRIGFTYGKITAKVKMPPLLNKNHVWHGITNAIWLITQDLSEWNNRRYSNSGYIPKGNPDGEKIHTTSYSEIDFEIIKASPFWPYKYYKNSTLKEKAKKYEGKFNDTIVVASTNWDLASQDPPKFNYPIQYFNHGDKEYEAMRWSDKYQALTIRTPVLDHELFGRDFYYFQIEWRPYEIIWRIGPSKDKLYEVGYMSEKQTSIPNNQMVMIINQEFHLAEWWPDAVYEQDYIPFLKNKNLGKIYEITIE